jgi:hypothetical protein
MNRSTNIDQVLIAERDPDDALPDQRAHLMLDQFRAAGVGEALRQAFDQADGTVRSSKQQRTGVRRHRAAVEGSHDFTSFDGSKSEQIRCTVRQHREPSQSELSCCSQTNFL